MKIVLFFLALIMNMRASGQIDYDKSIDKENNSVVMKGILDFNELKAESNFKWFKSGAESYSPHAEAVDKLRNELSFYTIVAVIGTWCDDSQNMVPKLYKTLILSGYPTEQVKIIGVDRLKEAKIMNIRLIMQR